MLRKLRYFFLGRLFPCALLLAATAAGIVALSIYLPIALLPIMAIERAFALGVCLFTMRQTELPETRAAWLLIVLLLPWTGAVLRLCKKRANERSRTCPAQTERFCGAFGAVQSVAEHCGFAPSLAQTVEYFSTGKDLYPRLLADLNGANKFILLEYYIVERGEFWNSVLAILQKKAREGVDVRLIYDDFGCVSTLPKRYAEELRRMGIAAYPFQKVRAFPLRKLNQRDHRKIAVIDGTTAYTGGINLADEYINVTVKYGHWKDTAVRLTGAPAGAFAKLFAERWNYRFPNDPAPFSPCAEKGDIPCIPYCDEPAPYRERVCPKLYRTVFSRAEKTLYLCTPYLTADDVFLQTLILAAQAGADVRLMIPHIPDRKSVFALTRRCARMLEACGVKIREYTCGFLHQKTLTADGALSAVGTYNLDFRSLYLQYECGVLVKDETLTRAIERDFLDMWEQGVPVPKAGVCEKIFVSALSLLSPLF